MFALVILASKKIKVFALNRSKKLTAHTTWFLCTPLIQVLKSSCLSRSCFIESIMTMFINTSDLHTDFFDSKFTPIARG